MANRSETHVLNGVSDFTAFGRTYKWSGNALEIMNAYTGADPGTYAINLTFTSKAWSIGTLRFASNGTFDVNINDSNDGQLRTIDFLRLGPGEANIVLYNTRVQFIRGNGDGDVDITLGSQRTTSIELFGGNDTIRVGTGQVNTLLLGSGNDEVTGGDGAINFLELGDGNNRFVGGKGLLGSLSAYGGNDRITLVAGADQVSLGGGVNALTTGAGYVGSILSYSGTNTISIGLGGARSVGLSEGVDVVTVLGAVSQISTGGNDDSVTFLAGSRGDSVDLGDGNNSFAASGDFVTSVAAQDGRDFLTLRSGTIDQAALGAGANRIIVEAGRIGLLQTDDGNDTVRIGAGKIEVIRVGDGDNSVTTGASYTESLIALDGNDTVTIGTGGARWVTLGHGANMLTTLGRVNAIETGDGADVITLGGSANSVASGGGADRLDLTLGRAETVSTGDAADMVTLGDESARLVALGEGDDTLSVTRFAPQRLLTAQDDGGVDTLDLRRFGTDLTVDLKSTSVQNIAAPGGLIDQTGFGLVILLQVENLVGSTADDRFRGSEAANVLNGAQGNDFLSGFEGDDLLIGARGDDRLAGGTGNDTFRFVTVDGRDVVSDFTLGQDLLEIEGAKRLTDLRFVQIGTDARLLFGALQVTFDDMQAADLRDAANFIF